MSSMRAVAGWIGWVALSLAAGQVGNLLGNAAASPLYRRLDLPSWAPPGAVFAPVWITLYVLMGTAAWLVWRERGFDGARAALTLFIVHLLFNAAWTGIFFGLGAPGLAFAEIVVLWLMIAALVVLFWRQRALAGVLLLPYLAWVTFAAALNYAIWRMNPGL